MASPTSYNVHIDEHGALGNSIIPGGCNAVSGSQQCTSADDVFSRSCNPSAALQCSVEIEKQQFTHDHTGTSSKKSLKVSFSIMPQTHTYVVDYSGSDNDHALFGEYTMFVFDEEADSADEIVGNLAPRDETMSVSSSSSGTWAFEGGLMIVFDNDDKTGMFMHSQCTLDNVINDNVSCVSCDSWGTQVDNSNMIQSRDHQSSVNRRDDHHNYDQAGMLEHVTPSHEDSTNLNEGLGCIIQSQIMYPGPLMLLGVRRDEFFLEQGDHHRTAPEPTPSSSNATASQQTMQECCTGADQALIRQGTYPWDDDEINHIYQHDLLPAAARMAVQLTPRG